MLLSMIENLSMVEIEQKDCGVFKHAQSHLFATCTLELKVQVQIRVHPFVVRTDQIRSSLRSERCLLINVSGSLLSVLLSIWPISSSGIKPVSKSLTISGNVYNNLYEASRHLGPSLPFFCFSEFFVAGFTGEISLLLVILTS